jgi:hypothetical protein
MKYMFRFIIAALACCFFAPVQLVIAQKKFDIVIYGGTSSGITAAIQAVKMGKHVILIEPGNHLGGMAVEGLGGTDIDNHPEFQNSLGVSGLALEFYSRISAKYNRQDEFLAMLKGRLKKPGLWRFESHIAEEVYTSWLKETSVTVILNTRLSEEKKSVVKEGTQINSIKMEDGSYYKGKVFIDATIEGDLLHAAGVSTVVGRESNSLYNETRNGIRAETTHAQFNVKVDPYIVPGDPTSGVIPTIQNEPLGIPGQGDHRLQAYCFRMCLTKNNTNQIPFTKPSLYDKSQYEIYIRYEHAGGTLYSPVASLPNGKTDLGAWHDLSHNLYGMNFEYPNGNYKTRQKIYQYHKDFTQGLFYFLSHDEAIKKETREEWSKWGLCKDEFTDNDGWPRQFYVRDARRMISDYVITEHHVKKDNAIPVNDPVGIAFWPPDVHAVRRMVKNGYAYNEGFVFGGDDWRPFGVSYHALVPKRNECTNLITPTCPSSSHIAYGAIRIEFTFMELGQAAGAAASIAIDKKVSVQDISYPELKKKLESDGQVISLPPLH